MRKLKRIQLVVKLNNILFMFLWLLCLFCFSSSYAQNKNSASKSKIDSKFILHLGTNNVTLDPSALKAGYKFTPLSIANLKPIIIKYSEKGLLVSTTIFNENFDVMAVITDNEWSVNPHNLYKKNNDRSAFEVIDNQNKVAFNMLIKGNDIFVNGIFRSPDQVLVINGDDIWSWPTADHNFKELFQKHVDAIERIFVYEGKHPYGTRIKKSK